MKKVIKEKGIKEGSCSNYTQNKFVEVL